MTYQRKTTAVATANEQPESKALVATSSAIPAELASLLEEDAAQTTGFEREDLALPFLRILQKMSPEVDKRDPKYVEGASDGDFLNTATGEVWSGQSGVIVVPIMHQRSITEWRTRKDGGGLVKDHGADDSMFAHVTKDPTTGRDVLPNGHELVRAAMYYVFIIDPETGTYQSAVLSLSATQLKKARRWNTLMETLTVKNPATGKHFRPAPFYMSYRLTTVLESNDKGSWSGVKTEYFRPVTTLPNGSEIYMAARAMREAIVQGQVKAGNLEDTASTTTTASTIDSDDVPF